MNLTCSPAVPADAGMIFDLCRALIDEYEDISSIDYAAVLAWVRRKIDKNITQYRRILCDGIGAYVDRGEFPMDLAKKIVSDICYGNAVSYFGGEKLLQHCGK